MRILAAAVTAVAALAPRAQAVPHPCVIVEHRVESTTGQQVDCPLQFVLL